MFQAQKWASDRVNALGTCVQHAEEKLASPGALKLSSLEMVRGQLAVLVGLLSEATAQFQDLESRFPQGNISIHETIHSDANADVDMTMYEEEVEATIEDESLGLELREFCDDGEEEEV